MNTLKRKRSSYISNNNNNNNNNELENCKKQYKTKKIKTNNNNNNIIISSQKRQYIKYQNLGINISIWETKLNHLMNTLPDNIISNNSNNEKKQSIENINKLLLEIKAKIKNYIEKKTEEIKNIEQIVKEENNATIEAKCINKIAIRNKLTLMIKYLKTKIKDINSLIENYNNEQRKKKKNTNNKTARQNRKTIRNSIRVSLQNLQGFNEDAALRELGMYDIQIGLEFPNETNA